MIAAIPSLAALGSLPFWASDWFEIVITALVSVVLPFVLQLLNQKVKAFKNSGLDETALEVVQYYWGSEAKQIKRLASDGKITQEEKDQKLRGTLSNAIDSFVAVLGGTKKAASKLGVAPADVLVAAGGKIEKAVTVSKNSGAQARSGNP